MSKRWWPLVLLIVVGWQWVLAALVLTLPLFPSGDVQVVEAFPDAARDIGRFAHDDGVDIQHLEECFVGVRTDTYTAVRGEEVVSVPNAVRVQGPLTTQYYKPVNFRVSRVGWPFYAFRMTERMGEQHGMFLVRMPPIGPVVVPLRIEPLGFIANIAIWLAALLVIWWGVVRYREAISDPSPSTGASRLSRREGSLLPEARRRDGGSAS